MNNTFSFHRFGMVLSKDFKEYFPKYGMSELSLLACYLLYYVLHLIFGNSPSTADDRIVVAIAFVMVTVFIAPFKLYGDVNDNKLGIPFVLLPVSCLEKFLSMLIIVVPFTTIIFSALLFSLDALISFIPFAHGFDGTFFTSEIFTSENLNFFLSIMLMQSLFFFGNVFFKKHKTSKSILLFLEIHFAIILLMVLFFYLFGLQNISYDDAHFLINGKIIDSSYSDFIKTCIIIFKYLYMLGLPLTLYVLSYFKIKNLKY
jgi:hypothetical protein